MTAQTSASVGDGAVTVSGVAAAAVTVASAGRGPVVLDVFPEFFLNVFGALLGSGRTSAVVE